MSTASFVPTIWAARLLAHLNNALVARNFFNEDYEGEITDYGNTVRINTISVGDIRDYEPNADMDTPDDLDTTPQDLVIDQKKAFFFQVDDVDAAQARATLMDSAMMQYAYKLAAVEDAFLFGRINAAIPNGNRSPATIVAPTDVYDTLVQLRTILVKANVPAIGRNAALPPDAVGMLLKDDRFIATGANQGEVRLQNGLVGRAAGFDIFEVNNTPGGNTIIAGHDMGGTFASQIVQTEAGRMERRFSDYVKGLNVYGAKVTIPQTYASSVLTFGSGG